MLHNKRACCKVSSKARRTQNPTGGVCPILNESSRDLQSGKFVGTVAVPFTAMRTMWEAVPLWEMGDDGLTREHIVADPLKIKKALHLKGWQIKIGSASVR